MLFASETHWKLEFFLKTQLQFFYNPGVYGTSGFSFPLLFLILVSGLILRWYHMTPYSQLTCLLELLQPDDYRRMQPLGSDKAEKLLAFMWVQREKQAHWPEEDAAFRKVCKGLSHKNVRSVFRQTLESAVQQVEDFLLLNLLSGDPTHRQLALLQAIAGRNDWHFLLEQVQALPENQFPKESEVLLAYHRVFHLLYFHPQADRYKSGVEEYLHLAERFLDQYYALTKFRYHCEYLNRSLLFKTKLPPPPQVPQSSTEAPVIQLYRQLIGLYHAPLVFEVLQQFFLDLWAHRAALPSTDAESIFRFLQNLVGKLYEMGDTRAMDLLAEMFHTVLPEGYFINNGVFPVDAFLNLMAVFADAGTREKNTFSRLDQLLRDHLEKLKPEYRDMCKAFAAAYCLYYKGDYSGAIEYLQHIRAVYDQKQGHLHFWVKFSVLEIRLYYDWFVQAGDVVDALEPAIRRFQQFIHRNNRNFAAEKQQSFACFTDIVAGCYRARTHLGDRVKARKKLEKKLEQAPKAISRFWLKEIVSGIPLK